MISNNYTRKSAVSSASTIRVDIDWPFLSNSELNVYVKRNSDCDYKYHRLSDFEIIVDLNKNYVDVENPYQGEEVTCYVARVTEPTQSYDLINGYSLDPAALEKELDKTVKLIQELQLAQVLGEQYVITSADPFQIAPACLRKDTLIYFDENGDPTFIGVTDLPGYYMVKVSDDDTAPAYLSSKVDSIQFEVLNPAGNETVSIKDGGLTIAKIDGLQTELDDKADDTDLLLLVPRDLTILPEKEILDGDERVYIDDNGTAKYTSVSQIISSIETVESIFPFTFETGNLVDGVLTVAHTLDSENINPAIYDDSSRMVIPDEIQIVNANTVKLYFTAPNWIINGTWRGMLNSGTGILTTAGEANTSSNSGTGVGITMAKDGVNLPFKSFTSDNNSIIFNENSQTIDMQATATPTTTIEGLPGLAADAQTPLPHDIDDHGQSTFGQLNGRVSDDRIIAASNVVNSLESFETLNPLAAIQGRVLNDRMDLMAHSYDQDYTIASNIATPNNMVDIAVRKLVIPHITDNDYITNITNTPIFPDISIVGANGIDAGSVSANAWYYIWIIAKYDGSGIAGLFSLSSTVPVIPFTYYYKRCIGVVRTDSSGNMLKFNQIGRHVRYQTPQILKTDSFTMNSWTSLNTTLLLPFANTKEAVFNVNQQPFFGLSSRYDGGGGSYESCYQPDSAGYSTDFGGLFPSNEKCYKTHYVKVDASSAIYYYAGNTSGVLSVLGFEMKTL